MKVLQVVADGAPGGGTNHVMQLLRGMSNVDCGLVTQNGSYLFEQASKLGIPVIGGEFFRSRLDRQAVSTIKSAIGNFSPDLVHCHGGRAAFFRSFRTYPVRLRSRQTTRRQFVLDAIRQAIQSRLQRDQGA